MVVDKPSKPLWATTPQADVLRQAAIDAGLVYFTSKQIEVILDSLKAAGYLIPEAVPVEKEK